MFGKEGCYVNFVKQQVLIILHLFLGLIITFVVAFAVNVLTTQPIPTTVLHLGEHGDAPHVAVLKGLTTPHTRSMRGLWYWGQNVDHFSMFHLGSCNIPRHDRIERGHQTWQSRLLADATEFIANETNTIPNDSSEDVLWEHYEGSTSSSFSRTVPLRPRRGGGRLKARTIWMRCTLRRNLSTALSGGGGGRDASDGSVLAGRGRCDRFDRC